MAKQAVQVRLPEPKRGRPSAADKRAWQLFCDDLKKLWSRLSFTPSSRGWCYLLEEFGLGKDQFDWMQGRIVGLRKEGMLPLNITAVDKLRAFEDIGYDSATSEAGRLINSLDHWVESWTPFSFWDDKDVFLMMQVEKIDLVNLFLPVCNRYRVPIANARGWADVNQRSELVQMVRDHADAGRHVVLLYAGDFDPSGLNISARLEKIITDLNDTYLIKKDGERIDLAVQRHEFEVHRFALNLDTIEAEAFTRVDNLMTGNDKMPYPLNDPRHPDFAKDYVQTYLRDYCNGYLTHLPRRTIGKKVRPAGRYYATDNPWKVEANVLVPREQLAHTLCEAAINQFVTADEVDEYEDQIELRRPELRDEIRVQVLDRYE